MNIRLKISFFLWIMAYANLNAQAITMATWVDAATPYNPYYSIFDGTTWTTPATISTTSSGSFDVYTTCNPSSGTVVATWVDGNTGNPTYAIYDSGIWSTATPISTNSLFEAYYDVAVTFNPASNQYMATWALNSDKTPYYSLYDGSSWTTPAPISDSSAARFLTFAAPNTLTGDVIAGWVDNNTSHIIVAIYSHGIWGEPVQIGTSVGVEDVFVIYDPYRNTTMITWAGSHVGLRFAYYSIYNGTTWSEPLTINNTITAYDDVYNTFDATSNTIIATWTNVNSPRIPYCSIFDGTTWSTPATISGDFLQVYYDVSVSYNPIQQKTVAVWSNHSDSNFPYFTVYNNTSWSTAATISTINEPYGVVYATFIPILPLNPPSNLTGVQKKNNFGTVYEYYNTITWTQSPSSAVVGYHIYKNDILISSVDAYTFRYEQHNQIPKQIAIYSVTAFDAQNNESNPIFVTIS